MKKNMMEKLSSLLLAAAMVFGVSVTAFAAVPTITFRGKDNFEVTSDNLFVDFNNVMPGDTLTQQVIFENQARDSDYIEVYLKAVPKASDANTSTEKEFLSELELTVKMVIPKSLRILQIKQEILQMVFTLEDFVMDRKLHWI